MRDDDDMKRDGESDDPAEDVASLASDDPSERDPRQHDPRDPDDEPKADEPQVGDELGPTDGEGAAGDGSGSGSSRAWKLAAVVAVVAAAVALGVLGSLLFFEGGSGGADAKGDVRACIPVRDFTAEGADERDKGPKCPPKGAKMTDGLVQKTTDGGFTIRAIREGRLADTVELHVREPDRAYIDIAHAQTHAALGQPIRVHTKRIDGRDAVVYMEDAPLLK